MRIHQVQKGKAEASARMEVTGTKGAENFGGKERAKRQQSKVRPRVGGKGEEDRGQKGGKIETKRKGRASSG